MKIRVLLWVLGFSLLGNFGLVNPGNIFAAPEMTVESLQGSATPINVNQATAEELVLIRGIGPTLAERIVEHRSEFGPFLTAEELSAVRGIGGAKLQKIKQQIEV